VTWVTTLLVIRILVPEDYGLIALAAAFIGFFSLISEVGLGPALIQSKSLTSEKIREIHGLVVVSCAVIIGFIELLSPVVAEFFSEPRLQLILSVLALQFLFEAFAIVPRNLLVRDLRFKGLAVIEMISRSAAGLGTLFLALHGFGVWSLVYGNLLGIALRAAGVVIAAA
jgi:O-antigen/teichoic acid export membrane protein